MLIRDRNLPLFIASVSSLIVYAIEKAMPKRVNAMAHNMTYRQLSKRSVTSAVIALMLISPFSHAETANQSTEFMNILITTDKGELKATLEQNAASEAFSRLLPLELDLSDYHATEKIADLPSKLPTKGLPDGIDPEVGDLTYFAPWGNLAIFYRDFGYSRGLIRLGRIEGDLGLLTAEDNLKVVISPADND